MHNTRCCLAKCSHKYTKVNNQFWCNYVGLKKPLARLFVFKSRDCIEVIKTLPLQFTLCRELNVCCIVRQTQIERGKLRNNYTQPTNQTIRVAMFDQ